MNEEKLKQILDEIGRTDVPADVVKIAEQNEQYPNHLLQGIFAIQLALLDLLLLSNSHNLRDSWPGRLSVPGVQNCLLVPATAFPL